MVHLLTTFVTTVTTVTTSYMKDYPQSAYHGQVFNQQPVYSGQVAHQQHVQEVITNFYGYG